MLKVTFIAISMFIAVFTLVPAYSAEPETVVLDTEWSFSVGYGQNFSINSQGSNVSEDVQYLALLISWARIFHKFTGGSSAAFSLEGILSYARQEKKEDRYLAGITPFLIYNFKAYRKITPWIEVGLGIAVTNLDPEGFGGDWGFTPQAGLGIRYAISDRQFLRFAYRFHHISNAGLQERNKSIDTNFLFLGYSFSF